jgi:hypothetical protein
MCALPIIDLEKLIANQTVSEHKFENYSCYIKDRSDEQICFGIVP